MSTDENYGFEYELDAERPRGKIVTFYSFKGGVGRTMALANVAFLLANHGCRVLVMDWDLEAPGLAYYFRGLVDPATFRHIQNTPGILDLLWDWQLAVADLETDPEHIQDQYRDGQPFAECAQELTSSNIFEDTSGCLHYIGAGQKRLAALDNKPYEEALSDFLWAPFFEQYAGGFLIEGLRKWSKENYDLVLIDSRTGLADAAGVCTMQLPDELFLCFILNRQNIDGVARVAAAVRNNRKEEIRIRAIGMRVARSETAEESDARARAITELHRTGQFALESAQEDLKRLSIPATENVPFIESLASLADGSATTEVLTAHYLRLASDISGRDIPFPKFNEDFLQRVRARLTPKHATTEYIKKLGAVDPARAIFELNNLLDSAREALYDHDAIEKDYFQALIEAASVLGSTLEFEDNYEVNDKAVDLARVLFELQGEEWYETFVATLERFYSTFGMGLTDDDEMVLLAELDSVLALSETFPSILRRLVHKRRIAAIYLGESQLDEGADTIQEMATLLGRLSDRRAQLSPSQIEDLLAAEIHTYLLSGELQSSRDNRGLASEEYLRARALAVSNVNENSNLELRRLRSEAHMQLVLGNFLEDSDFSVAEETLEAARWANSSTIFLTRFSRLHEFFLRGTEKEDSELIVEFINLSFFQNEQTERAAIAFFSRSVRNAVTLINTTRKLAGHFLVGSNAESELQIVLRRLTIACDSVIRAIFKKRMIVVSTGFQSLREACDALPEALRKAGIEWRLDDESKEAMDRHMKRRRNLQS